MQATREQLSTANSTVEELNSRLSEASGSKRGSLRKWFKLKTVLRDASGVTDISSSLEKVRACVYNAAGNCTQIKTFRSMLKRLDELVTQEISDVFQVHFDKPSLSHSVVLDFESCDATGNPITAEGHLRRKVLELLKEKAIGGVSAIGKKRGAAHGMGGVGKTTALRVLCHDEQVKQAYKDGICFLEFGQDADEQKAIKQVARCMRNLGGIKLAQEMDKASSLSDVISKGSYFPRERNVLLVCDDMWENENEFGYVPDVTRLLQDAPRSRLVISTRNQKIADSVGEIVKFAPLDAKDGKARKILLAAVSDISPNPNFSDKESLDGIQHILDICAELPLALTIAGRGLAKSVLDSSSFPNGVRHFRTLLEQDIERITVEGLEDYPGLAQVIESSLKQCRQWGESDKAIQRYGGSWI